MISTGNKQIDAIANSLLGNLQASVKYRFVMQWRGSKIPRGAKLGGQSIIWAQHGSIYGEHPDGRRGDELGYYNRLKEFEDGDLHEIEIFTEHEECFDPNGNKLNPMEQ